MLNPKDYANPELARLANRLSARAHRCENCKRSKKRKTHLDDDVIYFQCQDCGCVNDPVPAKV